MHKIFRLALMLRWWHCRSLGGRVDCPSIAVEESRDGYLCIPFAPL
jgi:hypothetical protein